MVKVKKFFYFQQIAMSSDNGVDARRPILCMPIRNNKFEIIGENIISFIWLTENPLSSLKMK